MRIYLVIIVTLLVVVGFGLFTLNLLKGDAGQILDALEGLDQTMAAGDWEQAQREIDQAREVWFERKERWAMVINHQEIDQIDMALARTTRYIKLENQVLAAGELSVLTHMLKHIPEKERFSLSNIF